MLLGLAVAWPLVAARSSFVLRSFTIEPGKTYTSRYRFVAYDGKLSRADAEQLWADYAHPPQVRRAGDRNHESR